MGGVAGSLAVVALLALLVGGQLRSISWLEHLFLPFVLIAPGPGACRSVPMVPFRRLRVPVGQRIDVRMTLVKGDKPSIKPVVCYQYDNGPVEQEFMARGENGAFAASLDAHVDASKTTGNLRVWMKAGDDRLDLPPITVVPRLIVKSVEAIITCAEMSRSAAHNRKPCGRSRRDGRRIGRGIARHI